MGNLITLPLLVLSKLLVIRNPTMASSFTWSEEWHRMEKSYGDNEIAKLSSISSKEVDRFSLTLEKILKVRVPGTNGHKEVNEFIINSMRELGWSVEEDVFNDQTPIGEITFRNIIATHNPRSCKRLVFACHYDSKHFKNGKFVGATDSAVPCSMMIEMARNLQDELDKAKNTDISLQFIFFDGEEAFKIWTDTDSIYGARHLAAKWNRQKFPLKDQDKELCSSKKIVSELDRIELFVLLDLLGAELPNFYSFFPQTSSLFKRLLQIENKLNKLRLLEPQIPTAQTNYFQRRQMIGNLISDDHVPFMKLDVDILHIIPYPFPKVWHKLSDNQNALHQPTINNLMRIFQLFISSYLHL